MVYDISMVKESYVDPMGYAIKCFESSINEAFDLYYVLQEADGDVDEKKKSLVKRIIEAAKKLFERVKRYIIEKYNQIKEKIISIRDKIRKNKEDSEYPKEKSDAECLQKIYDSDLDIYRQRIEYSNWKRYRDKTHEEILDSLKLDGSGRRMMMTSMFNSYVYGKGLRGCVPDWNSIDEEFDKFVYSVGNDGSEDMEECREHLKVLSRMYDAFTDALVENSQTYWKISTIIHNYYYTKEE